MEGQQLREKINMDGWKVLVEILATWAEMQGPDFYQFTPVYRCPYCRADECSY